MPILNARCNTCGTVFPSGIRIENSTNISFGVGRAGPCPRCRGTGSLIASHTTLDVIGEHITVKRGWISPENLAVIASSFERFQATQDNRADVEAQIAQAFPQLQKRVQTLSTERLLLLISLLLSLLSTWQQARPSEQVVEQMVEQALADVQHASERTLAEVFTAFQAGKTSLHGLRTKITHFFPDLKEAVKEMGFDVLSALVSVITAVFMYRLERRRACEQDADNKRREDQHREDVRAAQEYQAEIAGYMKRLVELHEQGGNPQHLKEEIIREIQQQS